MQNLTFPVLNEKSPVVVQSNSLIESRYSITVGEQRLLLAMISLIHPNDIDFKPYILKIQDLAKFLNIDIKNAYREADKITDRLMKRILHIPQPNGSLLKLHWVSSAIHSKGSVELSFDPKLKPYLLQLKKQFTQYRLTAIAQFKSMYTIRIYGLLKQYEKIGEREFKVEDLRAILGIEKDEYKVFYEFRRRVLNQAKKEFEEIVKPGGTCKSDLSFDIETIREGRSIAKVKFIIKKQAYQNELPLAIEENSPIIEQLKHYGVSDSVAKELEKKYSESQIKSAVLLYDKTLLEGKVKNTSGGYLVALIKNGAGQDVPYEIEQKSAREKISQEERKREVKETRKAKKEREGRAEFYKKLSRKEKNVIIRKVEKQLTFALEKREFERLKKESPDSLLDIGTIPAAPIRGRFHNVVGEIYPENEV